MKDRGEEEERLFQMVKGTTEEGGARKGKEFK